MVAIYDLDKINCSYDFLVFFQNAYLIKKKNKFNKLDIIILSGSFKGFKKQQFHRERNFKIDYAQSRLSNIVYQALNMFTDYFDNIIFVKNRKSLSIKKLFQDYKLVFPINYNLNIEKKKYTSQCIWSNLESANKNFKFAKLKISKLIQKKIRQYLNTKKKIITITLRESGYTKFRNSKLNEWKKIIKYIDKKKFIIIVLRDFEQLGKKDFFRKYELFPEASINLGFRAAIYNMANLNMFVSNGPQTICWINDIKSISWKVWGDGKDKSLFDDNLGFSKNEKSKILNNKRQILLSDNDTFDNLIKYKKYFKI